MFNLHKDGFSHFRSSVAVSAEEKGYLMHEVSLLERDKHAPASTLRFRRYGNAIILPWKDNELHWLPTHKENGKEFSGYDQGSNNPEHGSIRYFNALSSALKNSDFLKDLIIDDFKQTFGFENDYLPVYVGVHLVKVRCDNNELPGFSSPDCFHQDGEPFTFAHLVSRSPNAIGGNNYIASVSARNKKLYEVNEDEITHRFTLNEFMDSFSVCDEMVSHYVDHLSMQSPGSPVERAMILIDFSRTIQSI